VLGNRSSGLWRSAAIKIAAVAAMAVALGMGAAGPACAKAGDRQVALYKFSAEGGRFHATGGRHRAFTLVLRHAQATGERKLRALIRDWKRNGFRRDPPSAAVVVPDAPHDRDVLIVELRHPRMLKAGDVRFQVRSDKADGALERFADDADRRLDAKFGEARLFIDPTRSVQFTLDFFGLPPGYSTTRFAATFTNASFAAPGKQGYSVIATAALQVDFLDNQLRLRNRGERFPTDGVVRFTMTTQDPFIAGSVTDLPDAMSGFFSAGSEGPVPIRLGAFKLNL
jgi:hypothetical protein